jgi:hypothetical protein
MENHGLAGARRPRSTTDRATDVHIDLDQLITTPAPADLTGCTLVELRAIRDHYQDVENGLSYARRMVQGRLDTVATELQRRRDGATSDDSLLTRLPEALAGHSRGPGLPRPMPDLEPPAWADSLLTDADAVLPPSALTDLDEVADDRLEAAAAELGELEQQLSQSRHELHRVIDRVQDEVVGRYRNGAPVDDLLR